MNEQTPQDADIIDLQRHARARAIDAEGELADVADRHSEIIEAVNDGQDIPDADERLAQLSEIKAEVESELHDRTQNHPSRPKENR